MLRGRHRVIGVLVLHRLVVRVSDAEIVGEIDFEALTSHVTELENVRVDVVLIGRPLINVRAAHAVVRNITMGLVTTVGVEGRSIAVPSGASIASLIDF